MRYPAPAPALADDTAPAPATLAAPAAPMDLSFPAAPSAPTAPTAVASNLNVTRSLYKIQFGWIDVMKLCTLYIHFSIQITLA